MTDIIKSKNNVPVRYVDQNDGTFALKVATTGGGGGGNVNATIVDYGSYPGLTNAQLTTATVNVAGPLTNTQLRATPVPISGALTNTELRATPVPVSGTVATNTSITNYGSYPGLTNAQLASTTVNTSVNNTVIVKNLPTSRIKVGQVKLDVTDSQVQFPDGELINGVIIKASPLNSEVLFVGEDGVNTVNDGTGRGFFLSPGEATSLAIDNLKQIFIIGTANDFVSFIGS
ncbi:hypothetical protein UFOVP352_9 [uncultured Caudovirales phage]|uniref:Uncharacterized protein n=1 Tax=uncultured Caudovirales phage TaxID=2100421 RepID=A0A6J5M2T2_9CAUD|nr:hypothetical protein UFOVP352_9 [uncultured Caudovirales phage]CAB4218132.1 hypothetical protein UFOVP1607_2 [uncultured Caudovirales phage]